MRRLLAMLALAAVVLGIAGLAFRTEQSSAQQLPDGDRISFSCEQTADPTGAGTKGEVTCDVTIDIPDPLPLPDEINLTVVVSYVDVDGSGDPSRGDQLQCITVYHEGVEIFSRCRD